MVLSISLLILFRQRMKRNYLAEFEKKILNSMLNCHEFKVIWNEVLTKLEEG